jgi:hypothetical protein
VTDILQGMDTGSKLSGQFGVLARLYYPEHSYKSAVRLFRDELCRTRGLMKALTNAGYRENQRKLSPRQVQVIERFLGEP